MLNNIIVSLVPRRFYLISIALMKMRFFQYREKLPVSLHDKQTSTNVKVLFLQSTLQQLS